MGMPNADDFSHGSYGDYAGVAFYGPPIDGFWMDRLAVSERYIRPLFCAILDLRGDEPATPRLVREWNALQGWFESQGVVEVPGPDVVALLDGLAGCTRADVAPHCAGCTPEECLRCASAIHRFLGDKLARGLTVFIESE